MLSWEIKTFIFLGCVSFNALIFLQMQIYLLMIHKAGRHLGDFNPLSVGIILCLAKFRNVFKSLKNSEKLPASRIINCQLIGRVMISD